MDRFIYQYSFQRIILPSFHSIAMRVCSQQKKSGARISSEQILIIQALLHLYELKASFYTTTQLWKYLLWIYFTLILFIILKCQVAVEREKLWHSIQNAPGRQKYSYLSDYRHLQYTFGCWVTEKKGTKLIGVAHPPPSQGFFCQTLWNQASMSVYRAGKYPELRDFRKCNNVDRLFRYCPQPLGGSL